MKYCTQLLNHPRPKVSEDAYVTICDSLIIYSKNLGEKAGLKPLVYEPDKNLQKQLSNFLEDKVFLDDDDGKDKQKKCVKGNLILHIFMPQIFKTPVKCGKCRMIFITYMYPSFCTTFA